MQRFIGGFLSFLIKRCALHTPFPSGWSYVIYSATMGGQEEARRLFLYFLCVSWPPNLAIIKINEALRKITCLGLGAL